MKKSKIFVVGIIGLLVVAGGMIFTACSEPEPEPVPEPVPELKVEDNLGKEGIETLTATASVTATVYGPTGFIRVAWEPVSRATKYVLYRKSVDKDGTTAVKFMNQYVGSAATTGTPVSLTYDDKASFSNEFKVDTKYTYKVIAITDWSSTSNEAADSWKPTTVDEWLSLQNKSKDSNTISFDASGDNALLVPGSKLASPKEVNLTKVINYSTTNAAKSEAIRVSWKTEPNVGYIVSHSANKGWQKTFSTYVSEANLNPTADVTAFDGYFAYNIPLSFGEVYVEVIAIHSTTNTQTNARYYLDSDPASVTGTFARTILSTPTNFSVTEIGNGSVKLSWDKMWDAESYKVYRYKYNSNTVSIAGTGQIYESWAEVTDGITYYDDINNANKIQGTLTTELSTENNATWQYLLVSVAGDNVSIPASATTTFAFNAPVISATALGWDIVRKDWSGIHVSWTPNKDDETYQVFRYPIGKNVATNDDILGTSVDVTGQRQVFADGKHGFIDTPEYRISYRYELVATRGTKQAKSHVDVNTTPYSDFLGIGLTTNNTFADPIPAATDTTRYSAYDHSYEVTGNIEYLNKLMKDTEVIRVYRAPADASGTETAAYAKIVDITKSQLSVYLAKPQIVPLGPGIWRYKIEVVEGDKVVFTPTGQPNVISAGNPSNMTISINRTDSGVCTFQVNNAAKNARVHGTKLIVRYASSTINSADAQNKLSGTQPNTFDQYPLTLTRDSTTDNYTTGQFFTATTLGLYWAARVYVIQGDYLDNGIYGNTSTLFTWNN